MTRPNATSGRNPDPRKTTRTRTRTSLRLAMLLMGWSMACVLTHPADAGLPRVLRMEVTAYCPCKECCGPDAQGITASGKRVNHNGGRFVAADTTVLGFGQKLVIPGYAGNRPVPVLDRGGAIKGLKIDVFFPTHEQAKKWGRKHLDVRVLRGR